MVSSYEQRVGMKTRCIKHLEAPSDVIRTLRFAMGLALKTGERDYRYIHLQLSLNRASRWGTTDNFTTSFLHFSLFSTALWDLANSRPVHSLMLFSRLFFSLICLLLPYTVPCKMVSVRPDQRETC